MVVENCIFNQILGEDLDRVFNCEDLVVSNRTIEFSRQDLRPGDSSLEVVDVRGLEMVVHVVQIHSLLMQGKPRFWN